MSAQLWLARAINARQRNGLKVIAWWLLACSFTMGFAIPSVDAAEQARPDFTLQSVGTELVELVGCTMDFSDDGDGNSNNGFGNGDQEAPGGSADTNNAENSSDGNSGNNQSGGGNNGGGNDGGNDDDDGDALTFTAPASLQVGDVLMVHISKAGSDPFDTVPAGWVEIATALDNQAITSNVWTREVTDLLVDVPGVTTYQFTWDNQKAIGYLLHLRGTSGDFAFTANSLGGQCQSHFPSSCPPQPRQPNYPHGFDRPGQICTRRQPKFY